MTGIAYGTDKVGKIVPMLTYYAHVQLQIWDAMLSSAKYQYKSSLMSISGCRLTSQHRRYQAVLCLADFC